MCCGQPPDSREGCGLFQSNGRLSGGLLKYLEIAKPRVEKFSFGPLIDLSSGALRVGVSRVLRPLLFTTPSSHLHKFSLAVPLIEFIAKSK